MRNNENFTPSFLSACVRRLKLMRDVPRDLDWEKTTQELLTELCQNSQEMQYLVTEVCAEFDRWPGPASFRQFAARLLHPPPSDKIWDRERAWGPRPKASCGACNDNGWKVEEGAASRCTCSAGVSLTEELLQLIAEGLRRKTARNKPQRIGPRETRRILRDI